MAHQTLAETLARNLTRKRLPFINAETRICKIWHCNDFWCDIAREATNSDLARECLIKLFKDDVEGHKPFIGGIYGDLLTVALARIDYSHVAQSLVNEVKN